MYDKEKYRLRTCYHCGNTGLLKIEHVHKHEYGGPVYNQIGDIVDVDLMEHFTWYLMSCPVCHKVTLWQEYSDECSHFCFVEDETLYPQSTIDYTGVPSNIKTAFEAALKVKNIDTAICSLALRRVLEAICKDKGAQGKSLEQMIRDMIDKKILPEMFDDACWIIRQLGNEAAHAEKKNFSPYQIDQTILFMQNIINYLYTLPLKMQKLRETIETEKNLKTSDS